MSKSLQKKYQKKLNKLIRESNKGIKNDNLWLGRFEIRQKQAYMERFSDGSGGILHTILRLVDKKTGYYKDFIYEYAPYYNSNEWHLFTIINDFIVKDVEVWEEKPSPREKEKFIIDFRNIPISDEIFNKDFNFYLDVKHFLKEE